jgi:hypothetical protein
MRSFTERTSQTQLCTKNNIKQGVVTDWAITPVLLPAINTVWAITYVIARNKYYAVGRKNKFWNKRLSVVLKAPLKRFFTVALKLL